MIRAWGRQRQKGAEIKSGFTLVEILVALVVMGVAMTLIVQFLMAAMSMGRQNRAEQVAAAFAQEQLTALVTNPHAYTWKLSADGALTPIIPRDEKNNVLQPPSVMPPESTRGGRAEANLYSTFSWQGFSKLASPDSNAVEVTVQVNWKITWEGKERERSFTLTSSVSRAAVEGKA